jgi:hypothetical protein
MPDVLVGGWTAFRVVALEEPLRREPAQHEVQLPREVVDVLDAAIRAARAERRHEVRGIAREQHAPVPERAHAPALKRVDARPLQLEVDPLAQHCPDARQHALGLPLLLGIGLPAELKVAAPHVIGLAMEQRRLVAVERRIEPEPALGREVGMHVNVGDEEPVAEDLSLALEA